jgi:mevalonate kinase
MPAFSASAPGKLILVGEHAVVYRRPALAVPVLQVRARAQVTAAPHAPAGQVHLQAPAIGLEADLAALAAENPLCAAIQQVLGVLGLTTIPACTIRITSTIPVAAGLGSGAAVSVALIRALAAFLGQPLTDEQVCALAYEVEKLHHGTPSGIDNTVITYARPVYFVRGQPLETLAVAKPFTLVIGDTGVASPTAKAVGEVRQAWQAAPARYEALFDAAGALAQSARQAIETGAVGTLGPMLDQNQVILQQLGVSSPELNRLVAAARAAGALGAKLSGGGQGGNMLALATPASAPVIAQALASAGAVQTIITEVPAQCLTA